MLDGILLNTYHRKHLKIKFVIHKYKIIIYYLGEESFSIFKNHYSGLCLSYLHLLFDFNPKAETRSLNMHSALQTVGTSFLPYCPDADGFYIP